MNPHRNRNSEAALPQAPDYTSQFVIWFNFESILWISMKETTECALWGAAAKPPRDYISRMWLNGADPKTDEEEVIVNVGDVLRKIFWEL